MLPVIRVAVVLVIVCLTAAISDAHAVALHLLLLLHFLNPSVAHSYHPLLCKTIIPLFRDNQMIQHFYGQCFSTCNYVLCNILVGL